MKLHASTASPTVRNIHSCPNVSINLDLFNFFITSAPGFAKTSCNFTKSHHMLEVFNFYMTCKRTFALSRYLKNN